MQVLRTMLEKLGRTVMLTLFGFLICISLSCRKDITSEEVVYQNDFEGTIDDNLSGVTLFTYNGSRVSGRYNNAGFQLKLDGLPEHQLIRVSFDLYLHDTWAGNNTGDEHITDGPDFWRMIVDGKAVINTTFSNSVCQGTYCQQQSWPRNYPFHYDAASGAARANLPGVCALNGVSGGTTMYRIEKVAGHRGGTLTLAFKDFLQQNNTTDPLCDESWSLDNLSVTILKTN